MKALNQLTNNNQDIDQVLFRLALAPMGGCACGKKKKCCKKFKKGKRCGKCPGKKKKI